MLRKRVVPLFTPWSLALVVLVAGCDSPSGKADKSSSPATASDTSAPRAKTAESPTPAKAAEVIKAAESASPTAGGPPAARAELDDAWQFVKVLDLSKLPVPQGATMGEQSATQLHVGVPLSVPAAVDFYLGKLEALGWKRAGPKTAESITDSFAQLSLGKDGYLLRLMAMSSKPKETGVTISHLETWTPGCFRGSTAPRTSTVPSRASLYFTPAKVADAAAALRRRLKADGWQEYERAFSQKADRPDTADLLFRKKAYRVGVWISKPATQPNKSTVQYGVGTLAHDLPAPEDARHVEIKDSRWIMMCEVPRDLDATADYYRKAMREIGFPSQPHETPFGKALALSFESEGHDLVLVSLQAADEHTTKVKLEGYSAAFREAMKKADALAKAKRDAQEKADAQAKAERVKAFEEDFKRQDDLIKGAIDTRLERSEPALETGGPLQVDSGPGRGHVRPRDGRRSVSIWLTHLASSNFQSSTCFIGRMPPSRVKSRGGPIRQVVALDLASRTAKGDLAAREPIWLAKRPSSGPLASPPPPDYDRKQLL